MDKISRRQILISGAMAGAAALDEMARAGVRGIRLNLTQAGVSDPAAALPGFRTAVQRAKARGWHVQINTNLKIIDALHADLQGAEVPIVIDHFGGAQAAAGLERPGFDALVKLVKSGNVYVK